MTEPLLPTWALSGIYGELMRLAVYIFRLVFTISAVASMILCIYLYLTYSSAGAIEPNPTTGQVHSLNLYGNIRYITKRQIDNVEFSFGGVVCFSIFAAFGEFAHKKQSRKTKISSGDSS